MFISYLLKVNLSWALLFGLYLLICRRDTFFQWKRFTLLGIYLMGWLIPLTQSGFWDEGSEAMAQLYINLGLVEVAPTEVINDTTDAALLWKSRGEILLWSLYLGGMLLLAIRLAAQAITIHRLHSHSSIAYINKVKVQVPCDRQAPFSFFHWVFVNPASHSESELQEIMAHELAHARQGHSIDVILSELHCILCWPSPIVWLMRRELRNNLEYLADARVLAQGHNRKSYQYHLLQLSYPLAIANLYNHFNVSPLKKRIHMMNKKKSSNAGYLKYLLFVPMCTLISLAINAEAWAATMPQQEKKTVTYSGTVVDADGNKLAQVRIRTIANSSSDNGQFLGTTDEQGRFSVTVPEGTHFGFIYMYEKNGKRQGIIRNYNAQMLAAEAQRTNMVVVLKEPVPNMDELAQKGTDHVYQVVDEIPQFPGGNDALMNFMGQNTKYPAEAVAKGTQGRVLVQFTIDKEGNLKDIHVLRSVDPLLDAEAVRMVSSMPQWTPGKHKGQPVNVQFTVPVQFNLSKVEVKK